MSYEKQTWANGPEGGTPITAERLGHIEEGIEDASSLQGGFYSVDKKWLDGTAPGSDTPAQNLQAIIAANFGDAPGTLELPFVGDVIAMQPSLQELPENHGTGMARFFDWKKTAIRGAGKGGPSGGGTVLAFAADERGMLSSLPNDRSPQMFGFSVIGAGSDSMAPGEQVLMDWTDQNRPDWRNFSVERALGTGIKCASITKGCYAGHFDGDVFRNFTGMDFTSRSEEYPDGGQPGRLGVTTHAIYGRVWDNEVGIFIDWGLSLYSIFADVESNNDVGVVWRGLGGLDFYGRGENPIANIRAEQGSGPYYLLGLFSSGKDVDDRNFPSKGTIIRPAGGTESIAAQTQFSPDQIAVNSLNRHDTNGDNLADGLNVSYNVSGTGGDDGHGMNYLLAGSDADDLLPDGARAQHFQWDESTGPKLPLFYFEADTRPGMPYITNWGAVPMEGDFALYVLDISPVSDNKYLFKYPSNGFLKGDGVFDNKQLAFIAAQDGVSGLEELGHITLTGAPTGGTFFLQRRYDNNPELTEQNFVTETTADIPITADASAVQAAIEALASVAPGDVVVGGVPGAWTYRWAGNLRYAAQAPKLSGDGSGGDHLLANGAGLTGGTDPDVKMTFYKQPLTPVPDPAAGTRVRCYIRQTFTPEQVVAGLPVPGEIIIGHHGLNMGTTVSIAPGVKPITEDGGVILKSLEIKENLTLGGTLISSDLDASIASAIKTVTQLKQVSVSLAGRPYDHVTWRPTDDKPTIHASMPMNFYVPSDTAAIGNTTNSRTHQLPGFLAGGTWDISLAHHTLTDRGIYKIEAATAAYNGAPTGWVTLATGTSGGLLDGYFASQTLVWGKVSGVTMPDGARYIRITTPNKNASSTGYKGAVALFTGAYTGP